MRKPEKPLTSLQSLPSAVRLLQVTVTPLPPGVGCAFTPRTAGRAGGGSLVSSTGAEKGPVWPVKVRLATLSQYLPGGWLAGSGALLWRVPG